MNDLDKKEFSLFFLNCRRGMLELDVILLTFLDKRYYDLNFNLKNDFYDMLFESDNDLYIWIVKKNYDNTLKFYNIINDIINTTNMFDFY